MVCVFNVIKSFLIFVGGLVIEELDLSWCSVLYYTYCRNYFLFDLLFDK